MYIKYNGQRNSRVMGSGRKQVFFHKGAKSVVCVLDDIGYSILQKNTRVGGSWEFLIVDNFSSPVVTQPEMEKNRVETPEIEITKKKTNFKKVKTPNAAIQKDAASMNATTTKDIKKWRVK